MTVRGTMPTCAHCGLRLRSDIETRRPGFAPRVCRCLTPGVRSARAMLDALPAGERRKLEMMLARGDVEAIRSAMERQCRA